MRINVFKFREETFPYLLMGKNHTLELVLQALQRNNMQIVFVINDDKKLIGVCSDGDVRKSLLQGSDLTTKVSKIMNRKFKYLKEGFLQEDLKKIFEGNAHLKLPVLDNQDRIAALAIISDYIPQVTSSVAAMVIMAGGKGTRLHPLTKSIPKPLVPVHGVPLIGRILDKAIASGFLNIFVSVNHFSEQIKNYFDKNPKPALSIDFLQEEFPLGTGGSLSLIPKDTAFRYFIVTNGDVLLEDKFNEILAHHLSNANDITMVLKDIEIQNPYGVVSTSGEKVTGFQEKPTYKSVINSGVYVINREVLGLVPEETCSLPDVIELAMTKGFKVGFFKCRGKWFDVGTPLDLDKANEFFLLKEQEG